MSLQAAIEKGLTTMNGFADSVGVTQGQVMTVAAGALALLSAKSLFSSFFDRKATGAADSETCRHFEEPPVVIDPVLIAMASLAIQNDNRRHDEARRFREKAALPAPRPQRMPHVPAARRLTPQGVRHLMMVA